METVSAAARQALDPPESGKAFMLSYQHGYHAGGPADVHKHLIFSLLLQHLTEKSKPASVIDLYAGSGVYRLDGGQAQKTAEFTAGIARLWAETETIQKG